MKVQNKRGFVNIILHIAGFLLCTVPAAVCTLMYFPLWKETGAMSCIAGGGALIIIIFAVPLIKFLKRLLSSASAYMMWLVAFILFFSLSRIASEMTVISFVGFLGNLLGAILMKIGGMGHEQKQL